jgi:kynurenine formamidase
MFSKTLSLVLVLVVSMSIASCAHKNVYPTVTASHDLTKADVDSIIDQISNWKRWGADDERGTLNLVTAEKRQQAFALVCEAFPVSLSHNAIKGDIEKGEFDHLVHDLGQDEGNSGIADQYSVRYHGFTQTHIDALCHMIRDGKMYNGYARNADPRLGTRRLGVTNMKSGILTRGVLMDIARLKGVEYLGGSTPIYPEDLDAWEKKTGVCVQPGDAVLIRTGRWARNAAEPDWKYEEFAGLHASCLLWLKARDVAVIGSDLALDVLPSHVEGFGFPVHYGVLYGMGMPVLDNNDYEQLGDECQKRGRWSFLLTVNPLAVEGGTGSPVNPIAYF